MNAEHNVITPDETVPTETNVAYNDAKIKECNKARGIVDPMMSTIDNVDRLYYGVTMMSPDEIFVRETQKARERHASVAEQVKPSFYPVKPPSHTNESQNNKVTSLVELKSSLSFDLLWKITQGKFRVIVLNSVRGMTTLNVTLDDLLSCEHIIATESADDAVNILTYELIKIANTRLDNICESVEYPKKYDPIDATYCYEYPNYETDSCGYDSDLPVLETFDHRLDKSSSSDDE